MAKTKKVDLNAEVLETTVPVTVDVPVAEPVIAADKPLVKAEVPQVVEDELEFSTAGDDRDPNPLIRMGKAIADLSLEDLPTVDIGSNWMYIDRKDNEPAGSVLMIDGEVIPPIASGVEISLENRFQGSVWVPQDLCMTLTEKYAEPHVKSDPAVKQGFFAPSRPEGRIKVDVYLYRLAEADGSRVPQYMSRIMDSKLKSGVYQLLLLSKGSSVTLEKNQAILPYGKSTEGIQVGTAVILKSKVVNSAFLGDNLIEDMVVEKSTLEKSTVIRTNTNNRLWNHTAREITNAHLISSGLFSTSVVGEMFHSVKIKKSRLERCSFGGKGHIKIDVSNLEEVSLNSKFCRVYRSRLTRLNINSTKDIEIRNVVYHAGETENHRSDEKIILDSIYCVGSVDVFYDRSLEYVVTEKGISLTLDYTHRDVTMLNLPKIDARFNFNGNGMDCGYYAQPPININGYGEIRKAIRELMALAQPRLSQQEIMEQVIDSAAATLQSRLRIALQISAARKLVYGNSDDHTTF